MSRKNTSKVKRNIMEGIAKTVPNGQIISRKLIKTRDKILKCWASRNYGEGKEIYNWYGIFNEDIEDEPEKTILLFTTEDERNFLVVSLADFLREIKPYLRTTKGGYFFLVVRRGNDWLLPTDYIPKDLRSKIKGNGIELNKYVNNLSFLGGSYQRYLSLFETEEIKPVPQMDITSMIKAIAEKDPTFLAKSTEEKLIIIRYHQIKNL